MKNSELELVLDLVLEHRASSIADFLKERGLRKSGTKDQYRERILEAIKSGEIRSHDLVALLNRIEGWGNQHIFLFRAPDALVSRWKNKRWVQKLLKEQGVSKLLNKARPLVLPEKKTLTAIAWSPHRVRFTWICKRTWSERIPDEDKPTGTDGIYFKAYKERTGRGILAFDWNLTTGVAMIMIRRLPAGNGYEAVRDELISDLRSFIDLSAFTPIPISRAIKALEESEEVMRRQIVHETGTGSLARFTSRSRTKDALKDPAIRSARSALGKNTMGSQGNFYWMPDGSALSERLHTVLHARARRIGFFGERSEEEVLHVVHRIEEHCR